MIRSMTGFGAADGALLDVLPNLSRWNASDRNLAFV